MAVLRTLSDEYGLSGNISAIEFARFPDILQLEKSETDTDVLAKDVLAVLEDALRDFDALRSREGENLAADMMLHLNEIERLTKKAEECSPKSVAEYRAKLEAKMTEVLQGREIDENRILMEAAILPTVSLLTRRLSGKSHIEQLRILLESREPVGRRWILVQELNRRQIRSVPRVRFRNGALLWI